MSLSKLKLKNAKPLDSNKFKKQQAQVQEIYNAKLKQKDKITSYEPFEGKGLVCTSGKTVHGFDTKFRQQISKGDFIMIQNSLLKTTEERPVMLVVSQNALLLQEPFIQEFANYTQYKIKKQTKIEKGQDLTQNYKAKLENLNKTKGIKKATMDVRLKKGTWSYQRKKVDVDPNLSRQGRLDLREKMQKDKFCW